MKRGYNGISFPFRIGNKGGVVMSSTSRYAIPHIEESITQILGTRFRERVMEMEIGSDLDVRIFDPNDKALQSLIKFQIREILERQEPRIEVTEDDIDIITEDNYFYANIKFRVVRYHSEHVVRVNLRGERE